MARTGTRLAGTIAGATGLLLAAGMASAAALEPAPRWWAQCRDAVSPLPCLAAREVTVLAASARAHPPAQGRREGALLRLQAPERPSVDFLDGPEGQYRAVAVLNRQGTDWLIAQWPLLPPGTALQAAEVQFTLTSLASGQRLVLDAPPWPAPDGHLMVTVERRDAAEGSHLALLQRGGTRWSQVFRYDAPPGLQLDFRRWRADSAALHLHWHREARPGCPAAEGSIQLRDGPFGWDFVPTLPPPCEAAAASHSSS